MALLYPGLNQPVNIHSRSILYSFGTKEHIVQLRILDKIIASYNNVSVQDYHILTKLLTTLVSSCLQISPLLETVPFSSTSSTSTSTTQVHEKDCENKDSFLFEEILSTICSFEVNGVLLSMSKQAILYYSSDGSRRPIVSDALQYCNGDNDIKKQNQGSHAANLAVTDIFQCLEYLTLSKLSPTVSYTLHGGSPLDVRHQPLIDKPLKQWAIQLLQQQFHRCVTTHHLISMKSHTRQPAKTTSTPFPLRISHSSMSESVSYVMNTRNLTEVVQVIIDLLPRLLSSLDFSVLTSSSISTSSDVTEVISGKQVGVAFVEQGLNFLTLLLAMKAKVLLIILDMIDL